MTTALRAVASFLAAVGFVLAAVGTVAAADPSLVPGPGTLGAEVSAAVIADERPTAYVTNRGSVETTFRMDVPDGWHVEPTIVLQPGEQGTFHVTGSGDAGDAVILGTPTAKAGADSTAIRFGKIALLATRPFDPSRLLGPLLTALAVIAAIAFLLRRFRPWQWRLTRVA